MSIRDMIRNANGLNKLNGEQKPWELINMLDNKALANLEKLKEYEGKGTAVIEFIKNKKKNAKAVPTRKAVAKKVAVKKSSGKKVVKQIIRGEKGKVALIPQKGQLSEQFNSADLAKKYNFDEIDSSIIKYYEAMQKWCDELLDKVEYFEEANRSMIEDFNTLFVKLSDKYEDNDRLTVEENNLLHTWQETLYKKMNIGVSDVKNKLIRFRREADDIEDRLEKINESENPSQGMGNLEKEQRPSFRFVVENTSKIISTWLRKLDYFDVYHEEFIFVVGKLKEWQDSYIDFKTADYEKLQNSCKKINEDVWQGWYRDWQKQRWEMEKVFLPLVEYALDDNFHSVVNKDEPPVLDQVFDLLEEYGQKLENAYLENRSSIYIKSVNRHTGAMAQQVEWDTELNNIAADIQKKSSKIIFQCADSEDRLFLAKLLNPLVNYPLNELVVCIKDKCDQKVTEEILQGFVELQRHTYEQYLNDAKRYNENLRQREREFEELLFRLNQGLN